MENQELEEERIATYQRISKEKNIDESLVVQKSILEQYAKEKGIEFVENYVDIYKQTVEDRPAYNRLMKDILLGKIDKVVVVGGLERLSRNHKDMIKIFESVEIDIVYPTIKVTNLGKSTGDIIQLNPFCNEYYKKELSKKIKRGLELKKQKEKTI